MNGLWTAPEEVWPEGTEEAGSGGAVPGRQCQAWSQSLWTLSTPLPQCGEEGVDSPPTSQMRTFPEG